MRDFGKGLLILLMIALSALMGIFTLLWTLGTVLNWRIWGTGNKLLTVVFLFVFLFLLGITAFLLETYADKGAGKKRTGIDYEEYCGAYLLRHGFHDVILTPPSGDYGADLVAKDENNVVWVFQCKHYSAKVGNRCVQEVVAAKKHYGAAKAAVITNSKLTAPARELALENEVILFEGID